jgi:hypothetical protein
MIFFWTVLDIQQVARPHAPPSRCRRKVSAVHHRWATGRDSGQLSQARNLFNPITAQMKRPINWDVD